jgi:tryptophan synthase alpha chain
MTGLEHIQIAFENARSQGRAALMPYFTLGFPNPTDSLSILETIANSGADLIELGIPFSDPLADGPTIQHSTQAALEAGMTVSCCLKQVANLRARLTAGGRQPAEQPALLLMGYLNPLLAYGVDHFVADAAGAGADGLIIPDLPFEEAAEMETACRTRQLALIYLVAPTSSQERVRAAASHSTGFLYLVSLTGVTGARDALPSNLADFINRVRSIVSLPVAVGFGISTPDQAHLVGALADGVIVGSALINAVEKSQNGPEAATVFMNRLQQAMEAGH